ESLYLDAKRCRRNKLIQRKKKQLIASFYFFKKADTGEIFSSDSHKLADLLDSKSIAVYIFAWFIFSKYRLFKCIIWPCDLLRYTSSILSLSYSSARTHFSFILCT